MDNIIEKTLLYDFYGELLTDKQKMIYSLYYLEDLSLGEISEQMEISRQGVHDTVKRCHKQLNYYEQKLKLVEKFVNNKDKVSKIYQLTNELVKETSENTVIQNKLLKIQDIAMEILEDL